MKTMKMGAVIAAGLMIAAGPAMDWEVDPNHTEVTFEVRHLFTPVTGKFETFEVDMTFDPATPEAAHVSAVIQVASVDTNNDKRNTHLKTPDFFDAATFPTISFESMSVRRVGENQFVATGDLKIKDVTKRVELPITLLGIADIAPEMQAMLGSAQIASFVAELTIDRRDFGVGTGSWGETAIVGPEVKIKLQLEAGR